MPEGKTVLHAAFSLKTWRQAEPALVIIRS